MKYGRIQCHVHSVAASNSKVPLPMYKRIFNVDFIFNDINGKCVFRVRL